VRNEPSPSDTLDAKYEKLASILEDLESVLVAFSGGVDSTLLLRAAVDALGNENVLAVTADSETYPSRELAEARSIAEELGVRHMVCETSELEIPGYAENNRNRCYFCRHNLFEYLFPIQRAEGMRNVIYGLITDDLGDFRPGIRAAIEKGVRGPLQEAELGKEEVRELSRRLGLPNWNKPALACLSSRVAFGERITREKLRMIDGAEEYIRGLGVKQVRVRTHGEIARIEVDPEDLGRILESRALISERLRRLGYKYVTLDLAGYETGSMNRGIE